ncbi:MAG: hypothetical protein ATN33_06940 [Epulopiscium sp. Nele67-Bin001]|nr:MAG: hypothetical protein ATN33_06940 [Epulopiscium sp. Nele67-Bin001]
MLQRALCNKDSFLVRQPQMDDMIALIDGRDIPDLSASSGWKVPVARNPRLVVNWTCTGMDLFLQMG